MAFDKVVDSVKLDTAMTYTAGRIRAKTGGTEPIEWDESKGFGNAVDTITGGSTVPESDPRPIYGGTRPAEWLRLPDYDKAEANTMYLLVELKENYPNKENFTFRAESATVEEGLVENGSFVSKASRTVAGQGVYNNAVINLSYGFTDFSWAKSLSDGTKQIVVKISLTTPYRNIQFQNRYNYYSPSIIRDIVYNLNASDGFSADLYIYGIKYMYLLSGYPAMDRMYGLEGLGSGSNTTLGYGILSAAPDLRRLVGCPKVKKVLGSELLEELVVDISGFTANGISGNFRSLKKVVFSGTENMTAFPGDINFSKSNLSATAVADMFESLPDISSSGTARIINLKITPAAAEGISDATLAIATNKGWTVVTA